MKVKELIELLQCEDEDAEVHFAYNYGDYWRTTVAPKVRKVEESYVKFSDYHSMPALADDDDYENEKATSAVVLFS